MWPAQKKEKTHDSTFLDGNLPIAFAKKMVFDDPGLCIDYLCRSHPNLGRSFELVSDVIVRDIQSQYHVMVLSRQSSRVKWWLSKILAVGVIAFLYVGAGILFTLLTAAVHLPVEFVFSEHAQGLNEVVKFYGNMPADGNPFEFMLQLWSY
jgi:hypothetical protein